MDRLRNGTEALTAEDLANLPGLYSTEEQPLEDHLLWVKFFDPTGSWTWYAAEYDPTDRLFFGYVEGFDGEWGYFSLDELLSVAGPLGLGIERDLHFVPCRFGELGRF
jgi:hypothetical protein